MASKLNFIEKDSVDMSDLKHPVAAIEKQLILLWREVEHWQQDNESIHGGYRRQSSSYWHSFASLFYLHNETVNVYSHLLGAVAFASIVPSLYRSLSTQYSTATIEDLFVFTCFFAGCIFCLTTSGLYHLMSNHSQAVAKWGNQMDYLGIVVLIWGSFIPSIYYGFRERPDLVKVYWSTITIIGLATAYVTISPQFRTPEWRSFRASLFIGMGLSAVLPVTHGVLLFGIKHFNNKIQLKYLVSQGALYIFGAGLYAARVPEKIWPGRFDIFGTSHQIFHLFVLAAAATHLYGLVQAFHDKHNGPFATAQVFARPKFD